MKTIQEGKDTDTDNVRSKKNIYSNFFFKPSMTSRPEILDEIMFYILERAKCEEETDKYLEHVLDCCKKDYQQAFEKRN